MTESDTSEIISRAPADPKDEIGRFRAADADDVASAVAAAREAFPKWRDAGLAARAEVLLRFAEITKERNEELAALIGREVGKASWDAASEAGLVPAKVDVSLGAGMELVAPMEVGGGARATYAPRGVLAVLGPFNFPAHLANGHIVPALATGNTVVFKPSELAPAVGQWVAGCWKEAGLPDGVLQIVHGAGETGRALALHPDIDAVLFTGSYGVGQSLRAHTLDQPWKLLALEMGGKNAIIVCADTDLDLAVAESAFSIAVTTGQRCTCASRLFVDEEVIDEFSDKLVRVLAGLEIGPPGKDGVFMGPLVSEAAYAKLESYRRLLATTLRTQPGRGERLLEVDPDRPPPYAGAGLVRFANTSQNHPYQRDELFGPEAALYPVSDLDQAIAAVNDCDFGLAASLFSREKAAFERCRGRVRTGILNWNKGTVGASGKLPFGGLGRSGNDRPAGVSASLYCTFPQSHLESEAGFDPAGLPPGMPRP